MIDYFAKMYEETRVYTTTTGRQDYIPAQHYYTVDAPQFKINLDLNYVRTLPGLLKCLAIVS